MTLPAYYTQAEYDIATRAGICIETCQEIYEKYGQGASTAKPPAPIDHTFWMLLLCYVVVFEIIGLYAFFTD